MRTHAHAQTHMYTRSLTYMHENIHITTHRYTHTRTHFYVHTWTRVDTQKYAWGDGRVLISANPLTENKRYKFFCFISYFIFFFKKTIFLLYLNVFFLQKWTSCSSATVVKYFPYLNVFLLDNVWIIQRRLSCEYRNRHSRSAYCTVQSFGDPSKHFITFV